jgi:streptomycin 6-kinase
MQTYPIPDKLSKTFNATPDGTAWLARLPDSITSLSKRWRLTVGQPFEEEVSCSWVAPCDREDGTQAVLKLGLPHMEAENEIDGLLLWAGDPTALVLEQDIELNAVLLERCQPGTVLRTLPEPEQDQVIAKLLQRLWRKLPNSHPFRPLSEMTRHWSDGSVQKAHLWPDEGLTKEGLRLFKELPESAPDEVLLATDLHAGNVLAAQREPWLVIDPKPFYGDPAYDATQHLLNCKERLRSDAVGTIERFSDLLGVDYERVRLWTFARLVVETEGDLLEAMEIARMLG